jgi:RNA polymerase sigma-70 factor (ECF subfamily)
MAACGPEQGAHGETVERETAPANWRRASGSGAAVSETAIDFQSVHDAFRPRILRYLIRLVGEGDAEDLTQIVLLKVNQGLATFRGDSSLSTWIYRIATNSALDKLRSSTAEQPQRQNQEIELHASGDNDCGDGKVPLDAQTPSVEATAIRAEMSACIREFIERLPETYKTVMVLGELEGFKNAEIADILGVSLDTVKIRLHRAREKLRKDLENGCSFDRGERNELACERKRVDFPRGQSS